MLASVSPGIAVRNPHEGQNPKKIAFSDQLRKNGTLWERWLWKKLRKSVKGSLVWRQTVVRGYIVDFYLADFRIAIELDGEGHDPQKDSLRDARLLHKGITVMRFKNPKDQKSVNDIYAKVYAEICYQQGRLKKKPSTNSLALSEQQGSLTSLVRKGLVEDLYGSGNVQKKVNLLIFSRLSERDCRNIVQNTVENAGKGCQRQVYASVETAENTARVLSKVGIEGVPEICTKCGLIHMRETKIKLTPAPRGV